MVQSCVLDSGALSQVEVGGSNFADLSIHADQLASLDLHGVCTQDTHHLTLRWDMPGSK